MHVNVPRKAVRHILYSMNKVRLFLVLFNDGKRGDVRGTGLWLRLAIC
jgi:hypothetical protein